MTRETKSKLWQVVFILVAAIVSMGSARILIPFDQIKINKEVNIQQTKDLEGLIRDRDQAEKDRDRLYQALIRIEDKIDELKKNP